MIYFMQAEWGGPVKIGWVQIDLKSRLRSHQGSSPFVLKIVGLQNGDRIVENEIHCRFAKSRIRGEWFWPIWEMLELAPDLELFGVMPTPKAYEANDLWYWLERERLKHEVIGISQKK